MNSPKAYPNLPPAQRATQRLVDQFNQDERAARDLRERLLRKALYARREEATARHGRRAMTTSTPVAIVDEPCDVEATGRPFGKRWRQQEIGLMYSMDHEIPRLRSG
jgi:hypothetical protein